MADEIKESNGGTKWYGQLLDKKKSNAIIAYILSMMQIKDSYNAIMAVSAVTAIYIIGQGFLDFMRGRRDFLIKKMEIEKGMKI
jgi:hypothetical protein